MGELPFDLPIQLQHNLVAQLVLKGEEKSA
jgi:hypothetical protein